MRRGDYKGGLGEFSQDRRYILQIGLSRRLPSQPLYTRLGLGEAVLGYKDDFLTLALPCTPSCAFHIGCGLLRQSLGWASRGPIGAPCGPSVFICTRYPHTQESWGHPLVSRLGPPVVPGAIVVAPKHGSEAAQCEAGAWGGAAPDPVLVGGGRL